MLDKKVTFYTNEEGAEMLKKSLSEIDSNYDVHIIDDVDVRNIAIDKALVDNQSVINVGGSDEKQRGVVIIGSGMHDEIEDRILRSAQKFGTFGCHMPPSFAFDSDIVYDDMLEREKAHNERFDFLLNRMDFNEDFALYEYEGNKYFDPQYKKQNPSKPYTKSSLKGFENRINKRRKRKKNKKTHR